MKSISHEQNNASSINNSTNSLSLIESSSLTTKISLSSAAVAELDAKKRQKLDEYANIEDKQAKLLKILNERVYKRIRDEANIDDDELHRVFYVVAELEQLASMVHEQVALELRRRVQDEWCAKPYCGDILAAYYHYYKVYKAILERYPNCQCTLSNLLKRKAFAAQLKKLLVNTNKIYNWSTPALISYYSGSWSWQSRKCKSTRHASRSSSWLSAPSHSTSGVVS